MPDEEEKLMQEIEQLDALVARLSGDAKEVRAALEAGAQASLAEARVRALRDATRAAAIGAIRVLERELQAAIGSEATLRGLPSLTARASLPWHAARIRSLDKSQPLDAPAHGWPWGRETLCLDAHGQLVMARRNEHGEVNLRHADDSDLRAEDLRDAIQGVLFACECAKRQAQERSGTLQAIGELAEDLAYFLSEDSNGEDGQ